MNPIVERVVENLKIKSPNAILEASLNRVLQHITGQKVQSQDYKGDEYLDAKGGHYAIFTSWRQFGEPVDPQIQVRDSYLRSLSPKFSQNRKKNLFLYRHLVETLVEKGFGAIRVTGSWLDTDMEVQNADPEKVAFERSLFVPAKNRKGATLTLDYVKALGKQFNQDAVIYSGPETDGKVQLWGINKSNPEAVASQDYTLIASWNTVGVMDAKEIEKNLKAVADKIKRKDKSKYDEIGGTFVGGSGKGVSNVRGNKGIRFFPEKPAPTPTAESTLAVAFLFEDEQDYHVDTKYKILTQVANDTTLTEQEQNYYKSLFF